MRKLTLHEYRPEAGIHLTLTQREQLGSLTNSVAISPSLGETDRYDLTPSSWVGAVHLDDLDMVIKPKVSLDRLLFMLSYSLGRIKDFEDVVDLSVAADLPEAIVMAYVRLASRALGRGVQQGYRTVDESTLTLRGRLRIGDQIRRRYGPMPPAEVTYDDFTADIELNRILRAATARLSRLRLRSTRSRLGLRGIEARLEGVSLITYDPRRIPVVRFNRLNERYRDAVTLGRLILRSVSFDLGHGAAPATAFLIDMNRVFEDFVVEALRDALSTAHGRLVQGARGRQLYMDEARRVELLPDLSIWQGGACVFVGDVKYKRLMSSDYPNADIYQATAYAVGTGLENALLIYAASEGEPASHKIVRIRKQIDVAVLDLSVPPPKLLAQIQALADRIAGQIKLTALAVA